MTEKDLDTAIEMCERIMEFDTRTLKDSESENGWIFDKVYDLLKFLRQFQYVTDTNVGDMIDRQAALDAIKKLEKPAPTAQHLSAIFDCEDTIKALPSAQPDVPDTNVGDMISRQAALDALIFDVSAGRQNGKTLTVRYAEEVFKRIKALPPAQPNLDEWCDDCKEYDKERHCCPRWNRVIRQTVDDVKKERKPCNGCKHMGNDFKCNRCVRAAQDNYEPWEGGQDNA